MDAFLAGINQKIGEQMRWLRTYEANPPQPSVRQASPAAQGNSLEPLLLLMLFQFLLPMLQQQYGTTSNSSEGQVSQNMLTAGEQPEENPARRYLEEAIENNPDPENLSENLLGELETGGISERQLGNALMYMLHQGTEEYAAAAAGTTARLIAENALNPKPFLQAEYLARLDETRQVLLREALGETGPLLADGSVNRRLAASMVENAGVDSETGRFAEALLRNWLVRYPQEGTGAASSAARQILALSNLPFETQE